AVHDVAVASGAVARVYVDLPRGTRLARGVPRTLTLSRAVTMLRVGRGEGGVVRVVLELGAAGGYRVRRSARGLELSIAVAPPRERPRADRPEGAALARAGETRPPRIVIDPGHGGHDPGAQGYVVEKDESLAIARAVQRAVVAATRARYPYVADLGVKRGPFYVLVGAYMPCVLVETSFLTHPIEGRRLARAEYQATIAEGLVAGVARFL